MIIACDVDGVVAALHVEWYRRYNRDWDDTLTDDRVHGWEVHRYVKPECGKKVYGYLEDGDLYEGVPPVDGAVEGVARLRELGHTVLFVTSCTFSMVDQKARWLQRHGFCEPSSTNLLPHDLIVAHQKSFVDADLLIDDGGHNVVPWVTGTRRQRHAILLNYRHNRDLDMTSLMWSWCHRAHNWADIVQHVNTMETR